MAFDPNFGKTGFALTLFRLRFRDLRISQREFARRFGLSYGMVRDLEQGVSKPSRAFRVLLEIIRENPALVIAAAKSIDTDRL